MGVSASVSLNVRANAGVSASAWRMKDCATATDIVHVRVHMNVRGSALAMSLQRGCRVGCSRVCFKSWDTILERDTGTRIGTVPGRETGTRHRDLRPCK